MADTKISALSAGTALAGTEEIPGVQSAATVKFTPAQFRSYVQANMTAAVIASGTLTADANALTITQTWNNAGVTFSGGLLVNVTNTASGAASLLTQVQVGGVPMSAVTTDGTLNILGTLNGRGSAQFKAGQSGSAVSMLLLGFGTGTPGPNANSRFRWSANEAMTASGLNIGWSSSGGLSDTSTLDTALYRNAAGIVEINNGTAGTFRDLYARNVRTQSVAFASLVAAATAGAGARAFISDSSVTTFNTNAAAGGANLVPVFSDGTNWKVG